MSGFYSAKRTRNLFKPGAGKPFKLSRSKLEFDIHLIPYTGRDDWVEDCIRAAHRCLMADDLTAASPDCDFCNYRAAAKEAGAEPMGSDVLRVSAKSTSSQAREITDPDHAASFLPHRS